MRLKLISKDPSVLSKTAGVAFVMRCVGDTPAVAAPNALEAMISDFVDDKEALVAGAVPIEKSPSKAACVPADPLVIAKLAIAPSRRIFPSGKSPITTVPQPTPDAPVVVNAFVFSGIRRRRTG